jgi:hypothetical protein
MINGPLNLLLPNLSAVRSTSHGEQRRREDKKENRRLILHQRGTELGSVCEFSLFHEHIDFSLLKKT